MNGKKYSIKGQSSKKRWSANANRKSDGDVAETFDKFAEEELQAFLEQILKKRNVFGSSDEFKTILEQIMQNRDGTEDKEANESESEFKGDFEFPVRRGIWEQIKKNSNQSPSMSQASTFFVEDTRFWPVDGVFSTGKQMRSYQKLRQFERSYKYWVRYHLDEGLPTFFSILCSEPNVDEMLLEKVYTFKIKHSSFPKDVLDEAYRTLKNPRLRTRYLQFLKVFQNYYADVPDDKYKAALNKQHNHWQSLEFATILHDSIINRHPNWDALYEMGINLQDVGKIKENETASDLSSIKTKNYNVQPKEKILHTLTRQSFGDAASLDEYKIFIQVFPRVMNSKELHCIQKHQKLWKKVNFTPEEFALLLGETPIEEMVKKWYSLTSQQADWASYLPPKKGTLYTLLNIPPPSLKDTVIGSNKNERPFKDLLFEQYKSAQKTPEINLAYTTLRNPNTKADYDWMLSQHALCTKVAALLGAFRTMKDDHLKTINKGIVPDSREAIHFVDLNAY
ncbi:MAG: hypothetical protein RBG13Loki_2444 [Promethearchaeota archaeon CR_4]|nr:MAG: hypothetical protein RBG13Loki_2444 [Candidatus Lokiarchaeota archaeon CR_4]